MKRSRRIAGIALAVFFLCVSAAIAWTSTVTHVNSASLTAASVGAVTGSTATPAGTCGSVTVNWAASANATSYDVQVSANGGAFGAAQNVVTNSFADVSRSGNNLYTYRITPKRGANWVGGSQDVSIQCGMGTPTVTSATSCTTSTTVNWTDAGGSTNTYAIFRSINGAAFGPSPLATVPKTQLSYVDSTGLAPGNTVAYKVEPRDASATAGPSGTSATADVGFFIKSITFTQAGAATFDPGDSVDITFSRPAAATLPGPSPTTVRTTKNSGIAFTGTAISSATGIIALANGSLKTNSASSTGTATWTNAGTTWHWVKSSAATKRGTPFSAWTGTTMTLGTSSPVTCIDNTTVLTTTPSVTSIGAYPW